MEKSIYYMEFCFKLCVFKRRWKKIRDVTNQLHWETNERANHGWTDDQKCEKRRGEGNFLTYQSCDRCTEFYSLTSISYSYKDQGGEWQVGNIKVHLTPKIFFAKIIRLISWSNEVQKFFELVKSSNFYAPSKYVKTPPFWFATKFDGAWVEGRMWRQIQNTMIL